MPQLQQPDVVGNFLSNYYTAQQKQQADQDRTRTMQRQDVQDQRVGQQFQWTKEQHDIAERAQAVDDEVRLLKPNDAAGFEAAKQRLLQKGAITPQEAAQYDITKLPELQAQSEKFRQIKQFQLQQRQGEASIGASNAQAEAARANAAYIRSGKVSGGGAGAGGVGGGKITEGQAKDIAYLKRGTEANSQFTPDATKALIDTRNVVGRNVPGIGNALQSPESRQAVRTAKDFVAVVLRKDTGAAVTPSEFDFYEDIFIPQWGDDEGTLGTKAQARQTFLNALESGLGAKAALAKMGINPPAGLEPKEDGGPVFSNRDVQPAAAGGGWSAQKVQ